MEILECEQWVGGGEDDTMKILYQLPGMDTREEECRDLEPQKAGEQTGN